MAAKEVPVIKEADSSPSLDAEGSYGADDMTCAICLEQIQLEDTAYVKGCEHAYCGKLSFVVPSNQPCMHSPHSIFGWYSSATLAIIAQCCTLYLGAQTDQTCPVLQPSAFCSGLSSVKTAAALNARSHSVAC